MTWEQGCGQGHTERQSQRRCTVHVRVQHEEELGGGAWSRRGRSGVTAGRRTRRPRATLWRGVEEPRGEELGRWPGRSCPPCTPVAAGAELPHVRPRLPGQISPMRAVDEYEAERSGGPPLGVDGRGGGSWLQRGDRARHSAGFPVGSACELCHRPAAGALRPRDPLRSRRSRLSAIGRTSPARSGPISPTRLLLELEEGEGGEEWLTCGSNVSLRWVKKS